MFERYTERARRVIFFARYEASALASSSIDTEHLLLGLLREGGAAASRILKRGQLTHELVRREIEARGRPGTPIATSVDMPLSPEAKRVLKHASDEAQRVNATYIDTEHLLLGLLRVPECLAADILGSKGLHLEDVREETRLQARGSEPPPRHTEAFPKLVEFLRELEDRRAAYHVSPFHQEAVRVEVALPEEKWVVTFFPDGRVAVEVFLLSGVVEDEAALARLLGRLDPPKSGSGSGG